MPYVPSKLPALKNPDAQALASYLENELQALASSLVENIIALELSPTFVAPSRPRTGMIVYADGTKWNPGSGEGVYTYGSDGAWHFLEVPALSTPLSVALGGTGDTGTAWTSYTVTVTRSTGTATAVGWWKSIGKTVFYNVTISFSTAVTGAVAFNLPIAALHAGVTVGEETTINSHPHVARWGAASTSAQVLDLTTLGNPATNGLVISFNGVYESS